MIKKVLGKIIAVLVLVLLTLSPVINQSPYLSRAQAALNSAGDSSDIQTNQSQTVNNQQDDKSLRNNTKTQQASVQTEKSVPKNGLLTDRFIVKYKTVSKKEDTVAKTRNFVKERRQTNNKQYDVILTKQKMTKEDFLAYLRQNKADDNIEYIQPDYEVSIADGESSSTTTGSAISLGGVSAATTQAAISLEQISTATTSSALSVGELSTTTTGSAIVDHVNTGSALSTEIPPITTLQLTGIDFDGQIITMSYINSLDNTSVPAIADFSVKQKDGNSLTIAGIKIEDKELYISLTNVTTAGGIIFSYNPGTSPIRDQSGKQAEGFKNLNVANQTQIQDSVNDPLFPEQWALFPNQFNVTTNSSITLDTTVNSAIPVNVTTGSAVSLNVSSGLAINMNVTTGSAISMNVTTGSAITLGIDAEGAWGKTKGEGVTVAVLDTGIDITQEDLKDNIWTNPKEVAGNGLDDDSNGYIDDIHGWNFVDNTNTVHNPADSSDEWHGTHTAGIIAAQLNNNKGIAGVAPKVKIMPLQVFKNGTAYTSDIISAIKYAQQNGARIVNCSWGTTSENQALKDAIAESGLLFICAAGNSNQDIDTNPVYPASLTGDNIISVASIDQTGNLSCFSNYGKLSVDVAAPGENIASILPGNLYGKSSGTSKAAAFVSGEAALILSKYPNASVSEIKSRILNSVVKLSSLTDKVVSGGEINCVNALTDPVTTSNIIFQVPAEQNQDYVSDFLDFGNYTLFDINYSTATFTRSSIAYNKDGTQVAANQPRYGTGKFGQAVMIEEGTTNLVSGTNGVSNFGVSNGAQIVTVTQPVTGQQVIAIKLPHGTTVPVTYSQTLHLSTNTQYTISFDAWATGPSQFDVDLFPDTLPQQNQNFDGNYKHFVWTLSSSSTDMGNCCLRFFNDIITPNPYDIYITNVQIEQKPYATSYIDGGSPRSTESLTIPATGIINDSSFTVENWVNRDDSDQSNNHVIWKGYCDAGDQYIIRTIAPSGYLDLIVISGGVNYEYTSTSILNPGVWYHVAATFNGSTAKLYLNGVLSGTVSYATKPATPTIQYIGINEGAGASLNGLIDDLRISSHARSDAEIQADYTSNQPLAIDDFTTCKMGLDGTLQIAFYTVQNLTTFTRSSIAYKQDGTQVSANQPRFETGKFGQAIKVEEGTTNLWSGGLNVYNGYPNDISTTIQTLSETMCNQPITRVTYLPFTNTGVDGIKNDSWGHGVNSSSKMTFTAGNYYTATIYWRCNNPSVVMSGIPSNVPGSGKQAWNDIRTETIGNGWNRSVCTWFYTADESDYKYWSFKDPNCVLNEMYTIDWVCPQIEQKSYATSYINGTRATESLTTPTAGILSASQGTIEFCLYRYDTLNYYQNPISILTPGNGNVNRLSLERVNNTNQFSLVTGNSVGSGIGSPAFTLNPNTWYEIAITWSNGVYNVYVNGSQPRGYPWISTCYPSSFTETTLDIGFACNWAGREANALIDDLRTSNRARTMSEIQAAYASNQPLPVDEATTGKMNFDGDLLIFSDTWITWGNLLIPRANFGAVTLNDKVYSIGGSNNGEVMNSVEVFDPATHSSSTVANLNVPRYVLGAAAVNGKLYAIGGYNGSFLDTVEEYDPATNVWTLKAPMPTPRGFLAVTALNGEIYAIGGINNTGTLKTVEEYDPATDTWSTKADMPTARSALGAIAINDKIYAVGGSANWQSLNTLEVYDPSSNTWTSKTGMPVSRQDFGIATNCGILYAIGGYNNGCLCDEYEYYPEIDSWFRRADLLSPRSGLGVTSAIGKIFVIGGYNGKYITSIVDVSDSPLPPQPISAAEVTATSVTLNWAPVTGAAAYDIEVDRNVINNGTSTTYVHSGLQPGTTHTYRFRARNATAVGDWSSILVVTTTTGYTGTTPQNNINAGDTFNFAITGTHIAAPTRTITVTYNPGDVQLLDLCAFTATPDTMASGLIPGTNIAVNKNTSGTIIFTVSFSNPSGMAWTGVLNNIKFRANVNNPVITATTMDSGLNSTPITDSTLCALSLNDGTADIPISPQFTNSTVAYTASVGFDTANLTVTPTATDSRATVTVNGVQVAQGQASKPISLNTGGITPISIVVTPVIGSPQTYTINVTSGDKTPPGAPAVTGTTPTNNVTPTWSWISGGNGNGNYRYKLDDNDLSTGAMSTTATSYTPSSALSEGTHTLYVQESDTAGNWSASGSFAIVIELTLPGAPTVNGTTPTNNSMPTWNWISDGEGNGNYRYKLDNSDLSTGAIATTATNYTPTSALSEGTHTLYVQESDAVGNWSASGSLAIVIDLTPPGAPVVNGITPTNNLTPTWSWSSGGGGDGNYRYKLDDSDLSTGATATTITSYTTSSALSVGTHTLYVQERDTAGNWSASGSFAIVIDLTAPGAPIVTGTTPTNSGMPTWSWTSGGGGNGNYRFKLDNSDLSTGATATTATSFTPESALSAGTHTLYVQERVGVDNWSASGSFAIVIDITPPGAPVVTGTTPTNNVTPTWNWSSGGGGDGNYRYKLDSSDLSSGATDTTLTSYTPGSALSEGTHTLYVQERDDVGNWSISGSFDIAIDLQLGNPYLANLTISSGTLSPAFDSKVFSYTDQVGSEVVAVTVTPTAQVSTSIIKVNNVAVASGHASQAIPLQDSSNTITVAVTNGPITQQYLITVTKQTPAYLSGLLLNGFMGVIPLSPSFNKGTFDYTSSAINIIDSVTVTPTAEKTGSTVKVNGVDVVSGQPSQAISLNQGSNTITIQVTPEGGSPTLYNIYVTKS